GTATFCQKIKETTPVYRLQQTRAEIRITGVRHHTYVIAFMSTWYELHVVIITWLLLLLLFSAKLPTNLGAGKMVHQCPVPDNCFLVPITESLLIAVIMVKIGEYTCCQILVDLMVCSQLLFAVTNVSVRILVDSPQQTVS
ncbi:hypothetical protein STEG23_007257, partial [Scotinomys teguina]